MRLGTRASALALAQARWVAQRLVAAGERVEIVEVRTAGDRGAGARDKARWVSELERALLEGSIDLAVHSAKDLPTSLPAGLELAAVPQRADARDALCGAAAISRLRPGARVGTSSLRRAAQLRALREDLQVVAIRGNVDTRLRRLAAGEADALVLALAGLQRLGRAAEAGTALDELVPAAGQGALALEARAGEAAGRAARSLDAVRDPAAQACVLAERELVAALGASCDTPVGAHARALDGGSEHLMLTAWVGLPDGSAWVRDEVTGGAGEVAAQCAQRMIAAGAAELLAQATELAGGLA
ncbi:MAG TPA: hydroxymethylbilane synthase [Solirubrobacteraceae bacterium]|nr:hydroxymethylbilane synthase [Solirubrobacteraceae bacterium]